VAQDDARKLAGRVLLADRSDGWRRRCAAGGRRPGLVGGICFALCFFVTASIVQEFWRGARVRQEGTGTDVLTALIGLVDRNKRRYGGYIVHLGIVLAFLGFAGDGFKREEQVLLKPGQQTTVGHFMVRLDSVEVSDDGQKQMITGHLSVFEDGKAIGHMYPAKWFFRRHEEEPTTEVAIRRSISEDLYIVMPASDLKDQSASLHIVINPLVNWIWFGFAINRARHGHRADAGAAFSFAAARLRFPEAANTTTSLLIVMMLGGASRPAARAARRIGDDGAGDRAHPARAGDAEENHLHVRDVRTATALRVQLQSRGRHAGRAGEAGVRRPRPNSRSSTTTSRSTAARSRWRRRSTGASTGWRGRSRTCSARAVSCWLARWP
jgi:hypothetical protein